MKAVLVVLLLAIVACDIPQEIIDIAKCLIESHEIFAVLPKIIEAITNKEYVKILEIVLEAFPKIRDEVMECLAK